MELQPRHLSDDLVRLDPLTPEHREVLFTLASDPAVWEQHPIQDRWKPEVFQKFWDGAIQSGTAFALVDRTSGKVIGSSRYHDFEPERSRICIGYTFLARSHWGGGWNPRFKGLLLDHAFRWMETVAFHIGENNRRSRIAVERLGAQLEGATVIHDLPHVVYALHKSAWIGRSEKKASPLRT